MAVAKKKVVSTDAKAKVVTKGTKGKKKAKKRIATKAVKDTKIAKSVKRKLNIVDKILVVVFVGVVVFTVFKGVDYYTGWGNPEKVIRRNMDFAEKNAIYKRYDIAIEKYEFILNKWGYDESHKEIIKQVRLSVAKAYKDSQQYIKAIDLYKELTAEYERTNRDMYAWLLLELGDCYNGIYNTSDAVKLFTKIITEFEGTDWAAEALFGIAEAYRNDGNNDQAIIYYNKIIKKYKRGFLSAEAMTSIGKIYEGEGKETKAIKVYATVVADFPEIVTEYARTRHEILSERFKD